MKRHETRNLLHTWLICLQLPVLLAASSVSANRSRGSGERNQRNQAATAQEQTEIVTSAGPIAWQDDFETGNLSRWPSDTGAGGRSDSGLCSRPDEGVSNEQAHSGQYSL